ncbi:BPTI/Kunitz-type proteinase inhibitor domain-containing protein [Catalinimonas niigatensis]|uniref:BPTI/Kunitz-type proteinase inhibitor domain-containing protein n=1 Tax=Catalinimonas niigatensis TaxID=1397264 RepID=UPI002665FA19|nr:BPTI/Kunitz-type proteinase inhibitor domain-containing protein [Catalinimonas niigatensis]WPP48660.1 BPTI/Kunitz-type proteinase inhibitor domain-containing protein [Catalinimonas niigatensis]
MRVYQVNQLSMMMKNIVFCLSVFSILAACEGDCEKCDQCGLLPDPGPCEAIIPKYYFDQHEGKCKEFNWGGCDGTVPFHTLEECRQCEGGQIPGD